MHFAIPVIGFFIILAALGGGSAPATTESSDDSVTISRPSIFGGISPSTVTPATTPGSSSVSPSATTNPARPSSPSPILPIVSNVTTLSAQNITATNALLRGRITTSAGQSAKVFFVTASAGSVLNSVTQFDSYETLTKRLPAGVTVHYVSGWVGNGETTPTRTISGLSEGSTYSYRLCVDAQRGAIVCGVTVPFKTVVSEYRNHYFSAPTVSMNRATDVGAYDATITGAYRANSGEEVTVFLVYGTSRAAVAAVPTTYATYQSVQSTGTSMKKVRLKANATGNATVTYTIDDLRRDTEYFASICASYSGQKDGLVCSYVQTFTTDEKDRAEPTIRLASVTSQQGGMIAAGSVSMNDYRDGHVFLVYGSDVKAVNEVTKRDRFSSIYQSGDSLQRISLNTDVDGVKSFTPQLQFLTPQSLFYARLCVEFQIASEYNRDYQVPTIRCSEVKPFTTI